ncbi:hypothetical protein VP01_3523g1 [Puccinia sorghi]|uniref:Uncharacterized protein n=1 Tax=Puccinia sorghi TaxID=27349 RepID=A0A0L6UXH3_9BASI|nr:hypothetical protein VP01_3523g1 [Puccinia sorghi]
MLLQPSLQNQPECINKNSNKLIYNSVKPTAAPATLKMKMMKEKNKLKAIYHFKDTRLSSIKEFAWEYSFLIFGWQLGWSMPHVNCRKLSKFFLQCEEWYFETDFPNQNHPTSEDPQAHVENGCLTPAQYTKVKDLTQAEPTENLLATKNTICAAKQRFKNESPQSLSPMMELSKLDSSATNPHSNYIKPITGSFFSLALKKEPSTRFPPVAQHLVVCASKEGGSHVEPPKNI